MNQRYFIQLSFNGTDYHGWQIQKNAHTVQAELHKAMETVFRQKMETLGCGRTDTGVHAKEFFAHFDLNYSLTRKIPDTIYKFNSLLPYDIAIQQIFPVKKDVSARFDATSRTYQYFIHHFKNPFLINRSCYRRIIPDVEKMNKACKLLLNHSDFSCFSKSRTQVKTNICRIYEAEWFEKKNPENTEGSQLVFQIKADRFLRNMVRAIVGTLLEIGDGLIVLSDFKKILDSKDRSKAGVSVPACGLFLTEVVYPAEIFENNTDSQ